MNKVRVLAIFVFVAMLFSFANYSPATAAPTAQTAGVTIIFQEGVEITVDGVGTGVIYNGTHDTRIVTVNPDHVHGYEGGIWLDDWPCCTDALIRFEDVFGPDVGQIPVGATIVSASVGLFIIDDGTAVDFGEIHPDQPWDEATATWNSVLGGNGVTFGVDTTSLGVGIPEWAPRNQWRFTDVTPSLTAWSLDPLLNNGWGWKPDGGNTGLMAFHSSENGYARPLLSVTYLPLSPAQATQNLVDLVESLNLQKGINNNLDAKLNAVLQALDDLNENNDVAAINALQAFINAVEAQRGNEITGMDADALITDAQAIIDQIGD